MSKMKASSYLCVISFLYAIYLTLQVIYGRQTIIFSHVNNGGIKLLQFIQQSKILILASKVRFSINRNVSIIVGSMLGVGFVYEFKGQQS